MHRTITVETERQDNGFALGERSLWSAAIHMAFIDAAAGRTDALRFFNESAMFGEVCGYLGLDANAIRNKATEHFGAKNVRRYRSALLDVGRQPDKEKET